MVERRIRNLVSLIDLFLWLLLRLDTIRMSWYSANEFYPEWTVWQEAISDTLQKALK